jgi:peptidoglycan hydrolase-like protein with peptidoglycan-binding domain
MTNKAPKRLFMLYEYLNKEGLRQEASLARGLIKSLQGTEDVLSSDLAEEKGLLEEVGSGIEDIRIGHTDSNTDGAVSKIQTFLESHNYTLDRFGIDGIFGSETEGKVIEFQENNNLNTSGRVDSATLTSLESSTAKPSLREPDALVEPSEKDLKKGERQARRALKGGGKRVGASQLYNDLYAGLNNRNLCIAMVANAIAESNMNPGIAGDCGDYGRKHRENSIPIFGKGRCCSFGLWQYNICSGMGERFLNAKGNPNGTDEERKATLSDYNLQVTYMMEVLNSKYASVVSQERSVDEWVDWFVRTIERPRDAGGAVAHRIGIAKGLGSLGGSVA